MFEINIEKNLHKGVKLHRRDGEEYWKLQLVCCRDGCDNIVDMGECLCFSTEAAMVRCRDEHYMTCSTECWIEDRGRDEVEKVLARVKEHNMTMRAMGDFRGQIGGTEVERIDAYFDYLAEFYDGSDFYEGFEIEDCPI